VKFKKRKRVLPNTVKSEASGEKEKELPDHGAGPICMQRIPIVLIRIYGGSHGILRPTPRTSEGKRKKGGQFHTQGNAVVLGSEISGKKKNFKGKSVNELSTKI